ncbi:hypothetical protein B0H10DRAFT_1962787 [Mycena sp. CBHHK59/15]|nr:hypothetical protein B0H10DRAFT_1962787 [Mycena sp. CBHHK59/15]
MAPKDAKKVSKKKNGSKQLRERRTAIDLLNLVDSPLYQTVVLKFRPGFSVYESDYGILSCTAAGSVLSKKDSWIVHLIGGKAPSGCQYASAEAKADASGQRSESKKRAEPDTAGGTGPPHKKQQRDLTPTQSTLTGFRRNEMPYGEAETDVIQRQALRAIVSGRGFRGPRDAGAHWHVPHHRPGDSANREGCGRTAT